jgi:hypothetical protein
MLFPARFHEGLRSGAITLTFRRWSRPQAKAGGRYRLDAGGVLVADRVERIMLRDIADAEARRAGYETASEVAGELARHGGPLNPTDLIYRIELRYVAEDDPRIALRDAAPSDEEIEAMITRLEELDRRAAVPWTRDTLAIIERRPRVLSTTLATELGRERMPFKGDVRKLKALGLTISHDVGYELSPRGKAVLRRLERE